MMQAYVSPHLTVAAASARLSLVALDPIVGLSVFLVGILPQELGHEGRGLASSQEVPGGPFAKELGEPAFVFYLLIEYREAQVVGPMILASGQVADVGVSPHGAPLGVHQHRQHCLDVCGVVGEACGRTC